MCDTPNIFPRFYTRLHGNANDKANIRCILRSLHRNSGGIWSLSQSKEPCPCRKGQLAILAPELASKSPVAHRGCHQSLLHIGGVILGCMVRSLPYHIIYKGEPCGVVSNSGTPPQFPRLIMISHVLNAILPYPWCRCMFLRKMWDFCENQRRSTISWLSPAELSVRRIHKAGPVDLCQHIVWERCLELHELHSPWYGGWELDRLGWRENTDRKSGNHFSFLRISRIPASFIQFWE